MTRSYALDAEELDRYHQQGFLGPFPAFLEADELEAIRIFFREMTESGAEHPFYNRFSVRDWHLIQPKAMRLLSHPAVVDRVRSIAGEAITLWRSKLFHKRVGDGEIGWHQEWGYFNGEEIGNDKPSLKSNRCMKKPWDWTVWIALNDVSEDNGPLEFVNGSHKTRYPVDMVPMTESDAFHDPFLDDPDNPEIIQRALENRLVLDIPTNTIFDGMDPQALSPNELRSYVMKRLSEKKAAATRPFQAPAEDYRVLPMKAGEFVIFTERCMHRSLPNRADFDRYALNARYTYWDTLVYPQRLQNDFIDGSNLNITQHRCVAFSEDGILQDNVYTGKDTPLLV